MLENMASDENTPPSKPSTYPSYAGDSDSSGKKPTLRPTRSVVPHNTPLSGLGMNVGLDLSAICEPPFEHTARGTPDSDGSWRFAPQRRLTFENLMDVPLPAPNGEPSRYSQTLQARSDRSSIVAGIKLPQFSFETPCENPVYPVGSLTEREKRFEDPALSGREHDPVFEVSAALEALWEYGSTGSETREGLGEDAELDPNEFPLPTGLDSSGTEPPRLQREPSPTEIQLNLSTSRSRRTDLLKRSHPKPLSEISKTDVANIPTGRTHDKTHRATPSTTSSNYPISSPLSDGYLSLDEDEGEGIIIDARWQGAHPLSALGPAGEGESMAGVEVAYRIPLKFVKPEARRRTSLSAGSPFVDIYRATDPHSICVDVDQAGERAADPGIESAVG
ncbi:hypothetical protein I316_03615 [Kwoniella heveanensis BCC8398]|uniref:Uncharacterized protein n=1 Tax=Kwoniella heveanensis BCC8398 TaxID=1296120 RepID=A0A1B9GU49_9TREE|nr:hypothetical protein I316_03615 [Kwoniella heveanensis BCC8398]